MSVLLGVAMLLTVGITAVIWAYAMTATSGIGAAVSLAAINSFGALGAFAGPFASGAVEQATGSAPNGLTATVLPLVPLLRTRRRTAPTAQPVTVRPSLTGPAETVE
ncbi:hypothetical protein ACFYY1_40420 [Streptomyces sp. NPDC001890]|uniref:hypothetical protein n=1 Tax=Streptomyces sp. NPDC001890 TaxID=3364620 RepID=UPI0036946651